MAQDSIFFIIGGLGIFFFGMQILSEGLKKVAGEKLKNFLHSVTRVPIVGVLVGASITCLIQSSSATTVMVVGFVNAGLLGLKQAISVVIGANIGTTFTAWLVSSMSVLKITSYALPAIGIGFAIMTLAKSKKAKSWGQVLLGFGLLFIGLEYLKDAFSFLKGNPAVESIFVTLSHNPILGVIVGILFTVLLQSSSATIAIVQILAFNGLISFEACLPIILGDNIGTTITAQLAAMGSNINARRAAMSHTLFNVFGVAYMLVFIYFGLFSKFVEFIVPGNLTLKNVMLHIAVAHSSFNVINTLIFLPFIGLLERICIKIVPKKDDAIDFGTKYLEKNLLNTPSLALEQILNEKIYMLKVAHKATKYAMDSLFSNSDKKLDRVSELESVTDNLQSEITQYIIDLSERELMPEESSELPVLIHNVNDIERIGDHAQNLSELIRRKIDEKLAFTDTAIGEIKLMWEQVELMTEEAQKALKGKDIEAAKTMIERENKINFLHEQFKLSHIDRLRKKTCHLDAGFIYVEIIDNLEKIGDRLINIAQSVIGKMQWKVKIHSK